MDGGRGARSGFYGDGIEPGGHTGKHRHIFEEMIYVHEGSGHDVHEQTKYSWEAGDLICIPPMTAHQRCNDGDTPVRLLSTWPRQLAHEFLGGIEHIDDAWTWANNGFAQTEEVNNVDVNLPVERLPSAESGRSLAFVDPQILTQAGVQEGQVVELATQRRRRLLARAAARPQDRPGLRSFRPLSDAFLKPDLREKITFTPVSVEQAKRLVLEPKARLTGNLTALERELQTAFEEQQLTCSGMVLSVKLFEFPRNGSSRYIGRTGGLWWVKIPV